MEDLTDHLQTFDGPLDLLLALIRKNKVEITDIPISLICDQYMAYLSEAEAMESAVCLVIIHHKKPDCTLADALRVTFLGVFGNIATMGAGTLPMQSYCLYRRGLDAGSGLGIMASEYVLHKISVLLYATAALLLGGEWLCGGANGLARYILIGYAIGALIVLALTLIYTWDRVLALVLRLLDGLLHKPKWAVRRKKWAGSLTQLNREASSGPVDTEFLFDNFI